MYGLTIRQSEAGTLRLAILIIITAVAFIAYSAGMYFGVSLLTPLFFYIPIIIAAYWFPRQGVIFAVVVGIIQVLLIFYISPSLPELTYAISTASFYILVAIAVVISSLSGDLRDKEARYRGIFDRSETGIFLVHNETRNLEIEEANTRGSEILGSIPEDLKGQSLSDFWKDDAGHLSVFQTLSINGFVAPIESFITTSAGDRVPVLISVSKLPRHMLVITLTDISERKRAEEEIHKINLHLSTLNHIISQGSGSSSVGDLIGKSLKSTREFLNVEYGGATIAASNPSSPPSHFDSGDTDLFREINQDDDWRNAISGGEYFVLQKLSQDNLSPCGMIIPIPGINGQSGTMYFATRHARIFSAEEKKTLESIARETGTAVNKLQLSEDLMEANRKANLFLDIMMHDINNANLASLWYGDLLLEMVDGEARDIATKMIDGVHKSSEVIQSLETIRRIEETHEELKDVDLDQVIYREIRHYPDADITFSGSGMKVCADDLLGEIFSNLIGNSIKFGGDSVSIDITVERTGDNEVMVAVADDGPGVPDTMKDAIFNRFRQNGTQRGGKGLGLYIVKMLVERYGGRILVEDRNSMRPDNGAVFKFSLLLHC